MGSSRSIKKIKKQMGGKKNRLLPEGVAPPGKGKRKIKVKNRDKLLNELAESVRLQHEAKTNASVYGSATSKKRKREKLSVDFDSAGAGDGTLWRGQELDEVKFKFYKTPDQEPNAADVLTLRQNLGVKVQKNIDLCPPPVVTASDPCLPSCFQQYMDKVKLKAPTAIQSQLWPAALSGRDVVCIAPTGSGKTLGYLLPALPHIMDQPPVDGALENRGPVALVIVPTRELALQVSSMSKAFAKFGVRSAAVYGGSKTDKQEQRLREGMGVVAGTPGRLCELLDTQTISLQRVSYLVLDECDQLLKMGFYTQLATILDWIRPDRQTLLVSATFPGPLQEAAAKWLTEPFIKVRAAHQKTEQDGSSTSSRINSNITHSVQVCADEDKFPVLLQWLTELYNESRGQRNQPRCLIFVNKVKSASELGAKLHKHSRQFFGIKTGVLTGQMEQDDRQKSLEAFRSAKVPVLVATDVAGRGIDIKALQKVVNYDFPVSVEQFIHRVGRTGRQSNKGSSSTFVEPSRSDIAVPLVSTLTNANQKIDPALQEMADAAAAKQANQTTQQKKDAQPTPNHEGNKKPKKTAGSDIASRAASLQADGHLASAKALEMFFRVVDQQMQLAEGGDQQ